MITWRAREDLLDAAFAADIDAVLTADPATWIVVSTQRDYATQAAGRAAFLADPVHNPRFADPEDSAHCCTPARAVDVTLVVNGKDIWDYHDANWQRLYATILAHPRLHSGISFDDGDHIEQLHWQTLAHAHD